MYMYTVINIHTNKKINTYVHTFAHIMCKNLSDDKVYKSQSPQS